MKIRTVQLLRNFKLFNDNGKVFTEIPFYESFVLSNDWELKGFLGDKLADGHISCAIGNLNVINFAENPHLYFKGESETFGRSVTNSELGLFTRQLNMQSHFPIFCLWFIKDNAVYANELFLQNLETNNTFVNTTDLFVSKATGYTDSSEFTVDELNWLTGKLPLIEKFFFAESFEESIGDLFNPKGSNPSNAVFIPYNQIPRLTRAYSFLVLARSTADLVLKISSYIMVLECLFTTKDWPKKEQFAHRASRFLNHGKEGMEEDKQFMLDAFTVRSNYVHGNTVPDEFSERSKLEEMSIRIDSIIREIFLKIVDEEIKIFSMDRQDLHHYFCTVYTS